MKIKIKTKIISKDKTLEEDVNAIYQEDKQVIKYIEEEHTKVEFFIKKLLLIRENKELLMTLDFKEKIGTIYLKEHDKKFYLDINIKNIMIKDRNIKIDYEIEKMSFSYLIDWRINI